MQAAHRAAVAFVAAGALLLAGCGDDDTASGGSATTAAGEPASEAAASTDAPSTTGASTPATSVAVSVLPAADECTDALRTLEVAVEAYYAQNGAYPASESDLVDIGFIREEFEEYDVVPDTGEVVRVEGVPCAVEETTSEESTGEPASADDLLAGLTEEEIASIGGPECARELAEIVAAGERFIEREGRDPESLEEIADDLGIEPVLWAYDADTESLVPAEGSPCPDFFGDAADDADPCEAERRTLEVAVEAYIAQNGEPPATEDDLVGDFLRDPIERYDLDASGAVVVAPGGPSDV